MTELLRVKILFRLSNFLYSVSPNQFLQIYTINVIVEQASIPCVYIVMANRQRMTYRRIFERIRDEVGMDNQPTSFLLDFEIGYN